MSGERREGLEQLLRNKGLIRYRQKDFFFYLKKIKKIFICLFIYSFILVTISLFSVSVSLFLFCK